MKIFFTKKAEKSYRSIYNYIAIEWGEKVAIAFEQKTIDFINLLKNFPEIGISEVPEKQIHSFRLTRQTRIFYRIKKDHILILTFFDTRQSPTKKPGM